VKAALLFVLLTCSIALVVPALSLAEDAPNPALAACKAEYVQLGATAFAAKYGANEALGACLKAHGATTTPPPAPRPPVAPPAGSAAEAACKAEYLQVGSSAFLAKYGATEAFGACLRAHGAGGDTAKGDAGPASGLAARLCELEYRQSGAAAFAAKYGAGDAAKRACLQSKAAQARAIVAQCKNDEACVKRALGITTGGDKPTTKAPEHKPAADPSAYLAMALCLSEGKALGRDAFQAKYGKGKEALGACVKAALPKARSILAACKSSSSSENKDALRQCVAAALKTAR
jgi:hypothetical protein